jgi:hypothetical protein
VRWRQPPLEWLARGAIPEFAPLVFFTERHEDDALESGGWRHRTPKGFARNAGEYCEHLVSSRVGLDLTLLDGDTDASKGSWWGQV